LVICAAVCAISLAGGCGRSVVSLPINEVSFTAADGAKVFATLYEQPGVKPPGVVLIHDRGGSRDTWKNAAAKAQRSGYAVLAIDLRGHGRSTGPNGQPVAYKEFNPQQWLSATNDIAAAIEQLRNAGADENRIAVVGEGFGGALALHYAARHPDAAAVVLISPDADDRVIDMREEIASVGKRPVLLLRADGDAYSSDSCSLLKKRAQGLCEVRVYPGAAHGAALLDASATAVEEFISWLGQMVATSVDEK
jgi:dienelactone hydrolase